MSDNPKEKQRLLIVDDSKVIRVTARKILSDHFETVEAVDGENAWEILTGEATVSLVVSDLTMPKLDGFGLLKRIRSSHLPHIRELPVIIITGSNDTESTMERARQDGATDFIGKPFDAVHLLARTQAHANSHAVTTLLKDANTALEELTTLDALTGLANEAVFIERGYQQLSYAIRHDSTLALFRMEIDGYGAVRRKYGASFCETIIQYVAKILVEAIRQEDTVARIGTARFTLLLPGMNKAGVRSLAERINSSIATRIFKSGNDKASVTVSIGVAAPRIRRDMQLSELISAADECLSRAISSGGGRVVFDDDPVQAPTSVKPAQTTHPATANKAGKVNVKAAMAKSAVKMPAFHGEDIEVEEIEITSADFSFAQFGIATQETAKIRNRATTTSGCESKNVARPASGKAVLTVSTTAANATSTAPGPSRTTPPAGRILDSASTLAESVASERSTPDATLEALPFKTPHPPGANRTGSSSMPAAKAEPVRLAPKDRHGAIKPTRDARRPGILKRLLIWIGLARTR